MWLSVSDDGVGCDRSQAGKSGGLGLINMRERVHQLDGTFEFDSEPGRGTTVRATVPFRAAVVSFGANRGSSATLVCHRVTHHATPPTVSHNATAIAEPYSKPLKNLMPSAADSA